MSPKNLMRKYTQGHIVSRKTLKDSAPSSSKSFAGSEEAVFGHGIVYKEKHLCDLFCARKDYFSIRWKFSAATRIVPTQNGTFGFFSLPPMKKALYHIQLDNYLDS
jgi:hypothetical protein